MANAVAEYVREQIEKARPNGFSCVEAEENILRRMIIRQGVAEEIVGELNREDFSDAEYGMVFGAIQSLVNSNKQVDLVSVDRECGRLYGDGVRASKIIDAASEHYTTIEKWQDVSAHVKIVKDLSIRRQAISRIIEVTHGLYDPTKDVTAVLTEITDVADSINSGDVEWRNIKDVLFETYNYLERRQKGEIKSITSGIKSVDRIIGGFFPEELTIIAARPSVGKSAFGVNIALAAAAGGFKVCVVSAEMGERDLGQRLLSHDSMVDGMKLRTADIDDGCWRRLAGAIETLGYLPIDFSFESPTVEDIVSSVRRKARRGECDMLIIDYLQYLESRRKFKEERFRVGYISNQLKRLSRKAKIPVIALAQVSREADGTMPSMRMLRESGNIEQDADGIIFLHRADSKDDPNINPLDRAGWDSRDESFKYICVNVAKQRNGAVGMTNVLFAPDVMQYHEIAR